MATVWLRLRADVRLRWRALAALALLLGIIGGVVLTAAAGARRTDTAYPRLLSWANAAQVDVLAAGTGLTGYYAALGRLPQVVGRSAQSRQASSRWTVSRSRRGRSRTKGAERSGTG